MELSRNDLRIAVLEHEPATNLGSFAELLADAGAAVDVIRRGYRLPSPGELDGVIALGGSARASDPSLAGERAWIAALAQAGTPYLGICLGAQLLAVALGGGIFRGERPEIGLREVRLTETAQVDPLFRGLPARLRVFEWHADGLTLPPDAVALATSDVYRLQAFRWGDAAYGLQFHPEAAVHTVRTWPWVAGYLDQLQATGADAGTILGELAVAEPSLRTLGAVLLDRWLGLCAARGAGADGSSPRRATLATP
jgi:GMP synthase-like glutamine amidotransferase